jgi:hypothetical protein
MLLDSMKHAKGHELNGANASGIDFPLSREIPDLMTCQYPQDDVSNLSSFCCDSQAGAAPEKGESKL